MNLKTINEGFAVTEQINVADVETLASQGVKSLFCNRPDGEGADQPSYAEIERAALQHGMSIRNLPVVSSNIDASHVRAFADAYAELPRPLVAYCRSGTRSITLWALSQGAQGMPVEQIMAVGSAAGYDLSDAVRRIERTGR